LHYFPLFKLLFRIGEKTGIGKIGSGEWEKKPIQIIWASRKYLKNVYPISFKLHYIGRGEEHDGY
jgi:hypothetical protein